MKNWVKIYDKVVVLVKKCDPSSSTERWILVIYAGIYYARQFIEDA